jgi:hypothetical protein
VVFAGLYYSVNKLGAHYGHVSDEGEGESSGGVPPELIYIATDEGVESFCGMDINTFIEGQCMNILKDPFFVFVCGIESCAVLLLAYTYSMYCNRVISPSKTKLCTSVCLPWPQLDMARRTIILATVGLPSF